MSSIQRFVYWLHNMATSRGMSRLPHVSFPFSVTLPHPSPSRLHIAHTLDITSLQSVHTTVLLPLVTPKPRSHAASGAQHPHKTLRISGRTLLVRWETISRCSAGSASRFLTCVMPVLPVSGAPRGHIPPF